MPGGRPMPPSMPPIFPWICSSTFFMASLAAATIMSCSISTSPATSGSILTARMFFCPSILMPTMPPPAVASTRISAISCWSFSCICCAWRIICCMLPGSFTLLLLEISNLANFAAEHLPEALHFRIGQRAAGHFVVVVSGCGRAWRGCFTGCDPDTQRPAEHFTHGLGEVAVVKIQRVGFRRHHLQIGGGHRNTGVFHGVCQVLVAVGREIRMQPLPGIARAGTNRGQRLGRRFGSQGVGARRLRGPRRLRFGGPGGGLLGAIHFEGGRARARRRRRRLDWRRTRARVADALLIPQTSQSLLDGQQSARLHQSYEPDFQMKTRLQRKLEI